MSPDILSALHTLNSKEEPAFAEALRKLLTDQLSGEPVTIKGARDKFSEINRAAKDGCVQIVKGAPGQETVILSMKDLAAMLYASVKGVSFAQALDASGFVPVMGHRILLPEGNRSESELVLHRPISRVAHTDGKQQSKQKRVAPGKRAKEVSLGAVAVA